MNVAMQNTQALTSDETNPKDLIGMTKPPLRLVPPALLLFVARVMGLGAKKYGAYNWRKKKSASRSTSKRRCGISSLVKTARPMTRSPGRPAPPHTLPSCMGIILDATATDS